MTKHSNTNPHHTDNPSHGPEAESQHADTVRTDTGATADHVIDKLSEYFGAPVRRANRAERRAGQAARVAIFGNPIPDPTTSFDTIGKQDVLIRIIRERDLPYPVVLPELIDRSDIELVHHPSYVHAVLTGEPFDLAGSGLSWDPGRYEEVLISTSAVVAAVRFAIANHSNAGCTSSGLHHAKAERGEGFCTFNGLAIAAIKAVQGGAKRVLILDLDAHCGGGTAQLIAGREGIEQVDVSVSSYDRYANTPNATLYMARGDNYLQVIGDALAAIVDPESIDVVLYNAGMDSHEDCTIGGVSGVDAKVLAERERLVFEWANSRGIPVAFTLAGGYKSSDLTAEELADLHLETFAAAHASAPIAR